jgi:hypothetical protein
MRLGWTVGHVSTFDEPGLIQVTASYNLAYLGAQRRQATDGGFDADVVATGISHSGSTGPASAVRPRNPMQGLPRTCMPFR